MDLVLLGARLLLAAVFVVAAITKLTDRPGTRQAVIDFGAPARIAPFVALFLPLAELSVVVLLIPTVTAWFGALGALILLTIFSVGIGVSLARGKQPDCHCFGQLHSEPIGWSTLARNGLLALVAGSILGVGYSDPGASAVAWLGDVSTSGLIGLAGAVVSVAILAVVGWFVLHLLQQNGRILGRLEHLEGLLMPGSEPSQPVPARPQMGLPVGSAAPSFSLSGLYGETLTLDALRAQGKPVMLLFSDPGCGPCTALLPDVGRWQRERSAKLTVAVISRGTVEANRPKVTEHSVTATLIQKDREVSEQYQANGTPSAVIVNPDGTIGSSVAQGAEAIRRLVNGLIAVRSTIPVQPASVANGHAGGNGIRAVAPQAQPARHVAPQVGQDAPAIALPGLDSETVELSSFLGNRTLVLFWNPGCGYCQRMLGDLKAWEAHPPADAPRLLVVSTGAVEVNRAMGLRSTVVLDQGFNVGREFGASGTPSAALVDGDGKIASQIVVGAPAVLHLAGDQQATPTTG